MLPVFTFRERARARTLSKIRGAAPNVVIGQSTADRAGARPYQQGQPQMGRARWFRRQIAQGQDIFGCLDQLTEACMVSRTWEEVPRSERHLQLALRDYGPL